MSSDEDGSVLTEKRRQDILMTSNSTMTSSLERSLEIGAIHSDGLSDKERRVRAVKNTIKGKTHSVCDCNHFNFLPMVYYNF
uniref:BHLH domain-containing protein n=1 Tax=Heterorhabditis bacteriophora TaxID=37862 RepID=A0A1I7XC23_HETBA